MKNAVSKSAVIVVGFIVVFGIIGSIESHNQTSFTPQASDNTMRNAFITGCDQSGKLTASKCGCAYDDLGVYFNDKNWAVNPDGTDSAQLTDILKNGYTQPEIQAISSCIT